MAWESITTTFERLCQLLCLLIVYAHFTVITSSEEGFAILLEVTDIELISAVVYFVKELAS